MITDVLGNLALVVEIAKTPTVEEVEIQLYTRE